MCLLLVTQKFAWLSMLLVTLLRKLLGTPTTARFTSGEYEVDYTTNESSSGVYFYSLRVDGILMDTKKMIVLK